MKITLLNIQKSGDNKDYNGGFGTTFQVGKSLLARLLEMKRSSGEYFPIMPYGYLAAIFKNNGHTVNALTNEIPGDADLVIIQCSLVRHNLELDFMKRIRNETNSKIGLVGPFVSVRPDLFSDYADFIIQGEPEEAALKIRDGHVPSGIVKSNPINDLDSLPFPDWSIFPVETFSYKPTLPKGPFTFIQGSRGCVYTCNYCPYKVFGVYRERGVQNVVDEIEYLVQKYSIKSLMFRDPCFSFNKKRAAEIANEIIKRKINIEWGCETRLDNLDTELLELLYKSGLRAVKVGIESTNPNILKKQGRKLIEIGHQEKIIKYCDEKGVRVIAFYIIGLEEDTKESVTKTLGYAKRLNTDFANFTICTPIPGTEYYEQIKDRILEEDWEKFDNFHPVFKHKNFTPEELRELQEYAIVSYYIRPGFILKHLIRKLRREYINGWL